MKKKIISYFKRVSISGIKSKQLAEKLNIFSPQEYEQLKFFLNQLVEEGFLIKSGKKYLRNSTKDKKYYGIITILENGAYGFVELQDRSLSDIFIAGRNLNTSFNGDLVEVALLAKKKGKNIEGQVVKIIERKKKEFSGILFKTKDFYFVEPDDRLIHRDIYIAKKKLNSSREGDKVIVGNIEWRDQHLNPEGSVIKILGKAGTTEADYESIAAEFNFSTEFPIKVIEELSGIEEKISNKEIKTRVDFRNKNVFTIDPDDAKDFDDALSIEKNDDGNFIVGIHIADVSHYVTPGSELFSEAAARTTSVYLVGKVIPMLPEKISNQICSLVPGEDRLTYSVIIEITPRYKILNYQIKKTIICSKKRFSYEEAQSVLDKKNGIFYEELLQLNKIAQYLKRKRIASGGINFRSNEIKFILNQEGIPIDIVPKKSQETNSLVEEFMLLANKIVCTHFYTSTKTNEKASFVYRVHDKPDKDKLSDFSKFLKNLGYLFDAKASDLNKQFQILLDQVSGKKEENIVNELAIRSMAKAEYSTNNIGHYGLAFKHYTHFTSPIRRFPDLLVHILIYDLIEGKKVNNLVTSSLKNFCQLSSQQERNATEAERFSVKLKQIDFLKSKLGYDFNGIISGVTNFGIFVQLQDILIEGLIKIRDLDDDFYIYDEKNYQLKGRSKGKIYRLGDSLRVKLVKLDRLKRQIDFTIVDY